MDQLSIWTGIFLSGVVMHPHLIHALAHERQADLVRRQHFQEGGPDHPVPVTNTRARPIDQLRRSLGAALVTAGTRLMPPNQTTADWGAR
jgi:hypothetical protein